jgi:hypothetical protein
MLATNGIHSVGYINEEGSNGLYDVMYVIPPGEGSEGNSHGRTHPFGIDT